MAEIKYLSEYGRHQLSIDSISPAIDEGELSLSVTARSQWGGDHVMTNSFVLLTADDVVALRDALDSCLVEMKERKRRDRSSDTTESDPKVQPKVFRPRKRKPPVKG